MVEKDPTVAAGGTVDIEAWLNQATPDEVRVPICMNRALLSEFDQLITAYEQGRPDPVATTMMDGMQLPRDEELESIAMRLVELKKQIEDDESEHTFVFQKGDYDEWRKLLLKFPPTEEQKERFRGFIDHDIDGAAPAIIAFACIKPRMTEAQAKKLRAILPEQVWGQLREAAMRVNRTGMDVPKSVMRTVDQLGTALKSISPASTGSRSQNSGDASPSQAKANGRSTTSKSRSSG